MCSLPTPTNSQTVFIDIHFVIFVKVHELHEHFLGTISTLLIQKNINNCELNLLAWVVHSRFSQVIYVHIEHGTSLTLHAYYTAKIMLLINEGGSSLEG